MRNIYNIINLADEFYRAAQVMDGTTGPSPVITPGIEVPSVETTKPQPKPQSKVEPQDPNTVSRWQIFYTFHKNFGNKYRLDYNSYNTEEAVAMHPNFPGGVQYGNEGNLWGPSLTFNFSGPYQEGDEQVIEQTFNKRFPKLIKNLTVQPIYNAKLQDVHQLGIQFGPNVSLI